MPLYTACALPGIINLSQANFETGTYRITQPGVYKLSGDIVFAPNESDDFRPLSTQTLYEDPAYAKYGFFAAITIETVGVTLDMCGYSLKQSDAFAVAQRFYSNILLNSTPDIAGEGPAPCCCNTGVAHQTTIKNGLLGRSAQHGIMGNGNTQICITSMTIENFEEQGISLNGFNDVIVNQTLIGPTSTDVKVNAQFGAARNMYYIASEYLAANATALGTFTYALTADTLALTMTNFLATLKADLDLVIANAIAGVALDTGAAGAPQIATIASWLSTNGNLPFNNTMGIKAHSHGDIINSFYINCVCKCPSTTLRVTNSTIKELNSKVDEMVGLTSFDGTGVITGPNQAVFPVLFTTDNNATETGEYIIETAYTEMYSVLGQSVLDLLVPVDGMNVNAAFIDWIQSVTNEETLGDYFTTSSAGFRVGLDGYSRVLVGVFGIKADNVVGLCLNGVTVMSITNSGRLGFVSDLTIYSGEDAHLYKGAQAAGA